MAHPTSRLRLDQLAENELAEEVNKIQGWLQSGLWIGDRHVQTLCWKMIGLCQAAYPSSDMQFAVLPFISELFDPRFTRDIEATLQAALGKTVSFCQVWVVPFHSRAY